MLKSKHERYSIFVTVSLIRMRFFRSVLLMNEYEIWNLYFFLQETIRKAEEIFGTDNKDLYISFQALLNRSVH